MAEIAIKAKEEKKFKFSGMNFLLVRRREKGKNRQSRLNSVWGRGDVEGSEGRGWLVERHLLASVGVYKTKTLNHKIIY